jgi:hypothetical protein
MDSEGEKHRIEQGESTTQLAYENGLFWKTIWNHPNNAQLRKLRKDQNVLYPGDEIFIPALQTKVVTAETEKLHRFVRLGVPEMLNIQFFGPDGKPLAGEAYMLNVDAHTQRGNLDGEGWLRTSIPPNAGKAHVKIGEFGDLLEQDLALGHLDPVTELTGVQARLKNLGFYHGGIDNELSDELTAAVRAFRLKYNLDQAPSEQQDKNAEANDEPDQDIAPEEDQTEKTAADEDAAANNYYLNADEEQTEPDTETELDPDDPDQETVFEDPAEIEEVEPEEVAEDSEESEETEDEQSDEDEEQEEEGDEEPAESGGIDDAFRSKLREVHGV